MRVATVLIFLSFGVAIVSAAIYGVEIRATEEWWNENYFLKFNSPSGKTFYIDFSDGTIYREKVAEQFMLGLSPPPPPSGIEVPVTEEKKRPFISFVSTDLKIYDIYFENDDLSHTPTVEESKFSYKAKYILIRHRLDSFVGPNKKMYMVNYSDDNEPSVTITERSSEALDHFQIKTFGPYEKWEHTYDFSENGELALDHTLSPIPVSSNRSIPLPILEPNSIIEKDYIYTFVEFAAPSGTKYHITNQLNISPIRHDNAHVAEAAYITFTDPNGRTYDICFGMEDSHPFLVEKKVDEHYFGKVRLYSFAGPNRILYRIDHNNESDHEVPILVSNSSGLSDLQITLIQPETYYNKYVKYIFSDNGTKLYDRVDEIDWTPLNSLPAIPVAEVTADYAMISPPFLTLHTPSGNNYHIFTNQTNASIAVEKTTKNSEPLYISFFLTNGRKTHIYLSSGQPPHLEEDAESIDMEEPFSFLLLSFVTPDQKRYQIKETRQSDDTWKPSIQQPFQVKEPIDLAPENGLYVTIQNQFGWQYVYRFTWNGDTLVEVSLSPPVHFIDSKVLGSLIGK